MGWLRVARAVGGLLSLGVLLGLIVADFWFPGRTLGQEMIALLILLIGALLAVDRLLEQGPLSIRIGSNNNDNGG